GEELADRHGYFMHAKSLYRGVTQVPLLIAGPGWESGAVKEEGISLKQVLPMLLKEHASNAVLGVSHSLDRDFIVSTWMRDFYCIRDARWTLVHAPCESRGWGPKEPPQAPFPYPEIALFDRDADPLEMRNVSDEHPEKRDELLSALGAWFDALELAPSQFVDGMSHEMLEQLGYATEAEASVCEPRRITP
ncbi:MAG: hypothetical protein MK213_05095, partial [Planctomycetes bacterium]|nr:hypothetical protein [Planctomycetota bacterium]